MAKEHTGFTRREDRAPAEDPLETLRKKVVENRYKGQYSIDNVQLLALIERLQKAEAKLKENNLNT